MKRASAKFNESDPRKIARGNNHICGLNIIGLRRAGISSTERLELKKLYRAIFRDGRSVRAAVDHAFGEFNSPHTRAMLEFIQASKRGVCTDISSREDEESIES